MFKVEGWIERIQTEMLFTRTFATLEEAKDFLREDFVTRANDRDFISYGGYDIYEQTWKRLPRPIQVTTPTLEFI